MKNAILLLCLLSIVACQNPSTNNIDDKAVADVPPEQKLIDDIGLSDVLLTSLNTNDPGLLDKYYRELCKTHSGNLFESSATFMTVSHLVKSFNITEDNSQKATDDIAFYTEKFSKLSNCSADILLKMLLRLQGHWSNNKIQETAKIGYQNALHFQELNAAISQTSKGMKIRAQGLKDLKDFLDKGVKTN